MSGKNYKIAVLPGDGTGPEVTVEAVKVLNAAAAKYGFSLAMEEYDWDGNRYLSTGEVLPENVYRERARQRSCSSLIPSCWEQSGILTSNRGSWKKEFS